MDKVDKINQRLQNKRNNALGSNFEKMINAGCKKYANEEVALITKCPENFTAKSKDKKTGKFYGQFYGKAQPDYIGTLHGGRSILFEAKATTADRINKNAVTANQNKILEESYVLGAFCGVCIFLENKSYFIPWSVWRDMKKLFGRQYILSQDIEQYEAVFNGVLSFLELKSGGFIFDKERV